MFDTALQTERDLALDFWGTQCPDVRALSFAIVDERGRRRSRDGPHTSIAARNPSTSV